jgi:nucleotide-binding universal stress UspA family protein
MAISKILVPVTGMLDRIDALAMAAVAGRRLYAHVEALHVQADPVQALRYATGFEPIGWLDQNAERLEAEAIATRDAARRHFHEWAEAGRVELAAAPGPRSWDVSARWRECTGTPEAVIADLGRFADLIVFARPQSGDLPPRTTQIEAALFETGRPVLLAPPDAPHQLGREALIGWNGSREALHALSAALPLLSRMRRVVLLSIGETEHANPLRDEELIDYLACHGLHPERLHVEPDGRGAGSRLLHEAESLGADLLVMGAYTHSRIREAILGGATRHVIEHAKLPVLLAH